MKLLRVGGHPLHQILTDLPIGMWVLGIGAQWVGALGGSPFAWAFSFWAIVVGLATAVAVGLIGFYDFLHIPRGHGARPAALRQVLLIGAASACFAACLAVQAGPNAPLPSGLFPMIVLSCAGMVFLGQGARYGRELILRHRIGGEGGDYTGPERRAKPRGFALHV